MFYTKCENWSTEKCGARRAKKKVKEKARATVKGQKPSAYEKKQAKWVKNVSGKCLNSKCALFNLLIFYVKKIAFIKLNVSFKK